MTKSAGWPILLLACAFVAAAGYFASVQQIWVDETTQLTGLALPLGEQLVWLTGNLDRSLGVPVDRMPPLSYWIGSAWSGVFGLSEVAMRWLGIVSVVLAVPAVYLSGRMAGGNAGAVFSVAFFLASANIIVMGVEIRAYPIFLLWSCWAVWACAHLLAGSRDVERREFVLLGLFCLLAAYTHYFGTVLAACLFLALLTDRVVAGEGYLRVVLAGLVTALLMAGLLPFILEAVANSGERGVEVAADPLRNLARLLARIFLHPAHMVWLVIAAAVAVSVLSLTVLALARKPDTGREDRLSARAFASLAVGSAGVLMLLLALSYRITTFSLLAPHYNLWLTPVGILFLAGAFGSRQARVAGVPVVQAFAGLGVAGQVAATAVLLCNAQLFSHGPGEWVADNIDDPEGTVLILSEAGPWADVYFPVFYLHQGRVTQLLESRTDGRLSRITPTGFESHDEDADGLQDQVIRVKSRMLYTADLAQIARGASDCLTDVMGHPDDGTYSAICTFTAASISQPQ